MPKNKEVKNSGTLMVKINGRKIDLFAAVLDVVNPGTTKIGMFDEGRIVMELKRRVEATHKRAENEIMDALTANTAKINALLEKHVW